MVLPTFRPSNTLAVSSIEFLILVVMMVGVIAVIDAVAYGTVYEAGATFPDRNVQNLTSTLLGQGLLYTRSWTTSAHSIKQ